MNIQTVTLSGKRFVILAEDDYKRMSNQLRNSGEECLLEFPSPDKNGNFPAKESIDISIAREIYKRRTALGLSKDDLALLAGVRLSTIVNLEKALKIPSVATIDKIDQALRKTERRRKRA